MQLPITKVPFSCLLLDVVHGCYLHRVLGVVYLLSHSMTLRLFLEGSEGLRI